MPALHHQSNLKIGELAARLNLNPRTVRYYETIGLIPKAQRSPTGYRLYDTTDYERLRFILKAKAVGLSLEEIAQILRVRAEGFSPCEHVLTLVDDKLAVIDQQLRALTEFRQELADLREQPPHNLEPDERGFCRIIEQYQKSIPHEAFLDHVAILRPTLRQ